MPIWEGCADVRGSKYLGRVKAATKEEAKKKFEGKADYGSIALCHQCSHQCEDPEVYEINVDMVEESDEGFRREKFLYGVRARYRMTFGYWQFAIRTNFTTPV